MVVLKNDYSHCPLKKRPLSVCYDTPGGEQTEPQDLSLKCGKEAPSIHPQEPVKHAYSQEAQVRGLQLETSCTSNTSSTLCQRAAGSHDEGLQNRSILALKSYPHNVQVEGLCKQSTTPAEISSSQHPRVEDASVQRRYAQVIRTHDSSLQGFKRYLPVVSHPTSTTACSRSSSTHEIHTGSKHTCRRKEPALLQVTNGSSKNGIAPDVKKPRSDRLHFPPVTPLGTSSLPTCSQSHSPMDVVPSGMEIHPLRIPPPVDHVTPPRVPLPFGQFSATSHPENLVSTAQVERDSSMKCISPSPSAPHRPWLAEGPPRSLSKPYPNTERIPMAQATHPRSLLVGPSGLWAGMVPFTWSMPPILANPQPLSPRRPNHPRECYSPGSESASSDGSSGSARSDARYSCTECSKSYSTYSGLSKHKQFHCAALGAKSFACKHCDKVYTSLGALKMHIRTHTLPCKCPLCGKAFSRPWLLQGHIRTHTGEKPFQCPQCDRCFADRSNLRAHLQTHADIKKYACSTCHKTFSRMSLLNKHTEAACPAIQRRSLQ